MLIFVSAYAVAFIQIVIPKNNGQFKKKTYRRGSAVKQWKKYQFPIMRFFFTIINWGNSHSPQLEKSWSIKSKLFKRWNNVTTIRLCDSIFNSVNYLKSRSAATAFGEPTMARGYREAPNGLKLKFIFNKQAQIRFVRIFWFTLNRQNNYLIYYKH